MSLNLEILQIPPLIAVLTQEITSLLTINENYIMLVLRDFSPNMVT